ncbi:hypothetical protein AVEN_199390-1, partial [Araneus ventricosus]
NAEYYRLVNYKSCLNSLEPPLPVRWPKQTSGSGLTTRFLVSALTRMGNRAAVIWKIP